MNLGDFATGTVVYGKFTTYRPSTGAPFTLAGTPALSVYKDNSTTQSTSGVTLTVDFDGVTGLHHFAIDTSADGTFYSAGSFFDIVITTGTVDSVSAVGTVVGRFTLAKSTISTATTDAIVDAVWDEVLTGATHNVATSAGRRLRQIAGVVIHDGTAQAGTSNTITLDTGASATDGAYDPAMVVIVGGTGVGQTRLILQYTGSTRVAVVDRDWKVTPDNTSVFQIQADAGREHVNEGLAQGGTATTITLNALASSSDDAYNGQIAFIRSGTGQDQTGVVVDYNGTTKVATIATAMANGEWSVTPDSTSAYVMLPSSPVVLAAIEHAGAIIAGLTASGRNDMADSLLARNVNGGSSSGRSVKQALKALRNKVEISGGTMTVYDEDDATPSWTAAVSTAAGDPISGIDPA